MKGKKRQIQEILESFHLPGNRGRADSGWTKNFYVPTCIATMMLPLRRTLVRLVILLSITIQYFLEYSLLVLRKRNITDNRERKSQDFLFEFR